jgi:hypothetical protein
MSAPVHFRDDNGTLFMLAPTSVAAVQDTYHYPGSRYTPGCTVFLNSGEKIRVAMGAADLIAKLWPVGARQ